MLLALALFAASRLPSSLAHIAFWHPSMWGFNISDHADFPYDNRPVTPLFNMTFQQWWFHNHLDYPPHLEDVFDLPAGGIARAELACHKDATTWHSPDHDIRQGNNPCPHSPTSAYHTAGLGDVKGCALAIAYKSDVKEVQPEDFVVFSVNHTCVWNRFTDFQVPAAMPPCPDGRCICAWFWIHSPDSGSEQNVRYSTTPLAFMPVANLTNSKYMNGFQCSVSGSTSHRPVGRPGFARRCGEDLRAGKPADPRNCTIGAKQPFYWLQRERNNMLEDYYSPPFYNDLYGFKDGAQDDIFEDGHSAADAILPYDGTSAGILLSSRPRRVPRAFLSQ
ncbi:hypothetical protein BOTBODRAFT_451276 [Botryobasidium botryosum FD-172 SS1]|uniref:Lytic polysaccharide monooxygenase n=1 Tax=Botryobasidium botryosum (strain FD-172 SS1) TaxID=930990 RepID=A0A067M9Y1_BOTB1|nr:hypothetical protein BOTBODRAFT_451276 [Botryobasidium botryosum FD-172 SS1]